MSKSRRTGQHRDGDGPSFSHRSSGLMALCWTLLAGTAPIAQAGGLADVISDLYGGDGLRLSVISGFGHDAHFTDATFAGLDNLGSALAAGVGQLSFNSPVAGYTLDLETGEPVPVTDSLGPLLGERATTLGEKRLNVGFTYTHVRYTHFEGSKLSNQALVFAHPDSNMDGRLGPPPAFTTFELDTVRVEINLEIEQEIYALFMNYGLSEDTDVGFIFPVVHTRVHADAFAVVDEAAPGSPHLFDPSLNPPPPGEPFFDGQASSNGGAATGVGDVVLRVKRNFVRDHETKPDMAIGGQVVLPTGDEDDLLGTGETRLQAMFIVSKPGDEITPHVNLGYDLVPGDPERNSVRYIAGFDTQLFEGVTGALGVLGRWEHDGDGIGDMPVDMAIGTKWELSDGAILNGNILLPLNKDDGLRAEIIWTVGFEKTF